MKSTASRRRLGLILLLAGLAFPLGLTTPAALAQKAVTRTASAPAKALDAQVDVPIRKITLYRSGVGFFERQGLVTGDAQIQLRFTTDQINDILKSLVLLDLGKGRVESVSYGSKEPLGRRLASFGVNIADNPSIPNLLNQLRGARIKVSTPGEPLSGVILGVEDRLVPGSGEQPPARFPHLNLLTGSGMRSININEINSFELEDKELAEELNKALAALAEYRADRTKTVDVRFGADGQNGERSVVIGYVHEMPVWKTSYRLILPENDAKKASFAVQGWAIVENNTDNDWNDVRLSLVSGRPVSFQMDLYEPLYVARPFIPVPTVPGVAPRAYAGGTDLQLADAVRESEQLSSLSARGAPRPASPAASMAPDAPARDRAEAKRAYAGFSAGEMTDYAAASRAAAGEIGEVFQYELDSPVTIERQRSAMIPILGASLSGRRVSIFNSSDASEHPMRGVEITNDSGLQLLPGPISVFDSGAAAPGADPSSAYAGDAQIGHIPPGDKRLLAYAVDLDVTTITSTKNDSAVTRLRIVDGVFEQTVKSVMSTTYGFKNADQHRARTILVEHSKAPNWTLVAPAKPAEETQNLYRFEVQAAAGKSETLTVTQELVDRQTVGVTSYDLPTILRFQQQGKVSDKVVQTVREIGRRQAEINTVDREIQELDRQTEEINKDQARVRENMGRIDKSSQLYSRYMTKLTEQETTLEDINTRRAAAKEKADGLRAALQEYIRTLNVE